MANRTVTTPGIWANGAPDVPTTPATGVTYKNSAITESEIENAWAFGNTADSSRINELLYRLSVLMRLLEQNGSLPYCTTTTYSKGGVCLGSDGTMYESIADSNYGHDPVADATHVYWLEHARDKNPVGTVLALAHTTVPSGYLECNGAAISRTTYAALFVALGTAYGVGNGTTTFNLPDMRGVFQRGYDHGRLVDSGRVFGSSQLDALQNITGSFGIDDITMTRTTPTGAFQYDGVEISNAGPADVGDAGTCTFDASRVARTASETRPRNITVMYVIKY